MGPRGGQDKDSNEKEIKERDKTIADKEQRIFDLKKQPPGRNEVR